MPFANLRVAKASTLLSQFAGLDLAMDPSIAASLLIFCDGLVDLLVEFGDSPLDDADQALDVSPNRLRRRLESALLGHDDRDELAASSHEIGRFVLSGAGQGAFEVDVLVR